MNYLGTDTSLPNIQNCETIFSYLETKKKSKDLDPDQKWISTWNQYFHRIKHFFRWYFNCGFKLLEVNPNDTHIEQQFYENENQENWKSPDSLKNLKEKRKK